MQQVWRNRLRRISCRAIQPWCLSSLVNDECFIADVKKQVAKMKEYFGVEPKVPAIPPFIYSDEIGSTAPRWASRNVDRRSKAHPRLEIAALPVPLRPCTAAQALAARRETQRRHLPALQQQRLGRLSTLRRQLCWTRLRHPEESQIINIFMELSALGIAQPLSSTSWSSSVPCRSVPRSVA